MTVHQAQPRSVGSLDIGKVDYDKDRQIFSVDMTFRANCYIDEDVIKSAALAGARNFQMLLHRNGFWNYGPPETTVSRLSDKSVYFVIACKAQAGKRPDPIKLVVPEGESDEG